MGYCDYRCHEITRVVEENGSIPMGEIEDRFPAQKEEVRAWRSVTTTLAAAAIMAMAMKPAKKKM